MTHSLLACRMGMMENSQYQTTATAAAVDVLGYSCRRGTPRACSTSRRSVWR